MIRVDIDRAGPQGVSLDDCKRVSRALEAALDVYEPLGSRYVLEVSSPGLDRPIRTADDLRRNRGRRVEVTTSEPFGGRTGLRGVLLESDGTCLRLREDELGELSLPLGQVAFARQEIAI
jgi:ribosome maturation factor RimP